MREEGWEMEYVILGLLILKPQTLYRLNKAFEQSISLFYSASYGSLQAAIKKLLKKEYIDYEEVIENGRNKKIYYSSSKGQEAFYQWMKDEIRENKLEVEALSKVFLLGMMEEKEEKRKIVRDIIEKNQRAKEELMVIQERVGDRGSSSHNRVSYYKRKTLDYGIESYSFAIHWFQQLLQEIEASD